MKVCANCQRKYSDSLEYCLADGTVLSPMDDPQATLRIEARPTHPGAPAKRGIPVILFALAAIVLAGTVGVIAFIVLYSRWTNKAAVDPNRSNNTPVSTTSAPANNPPSSTKEEEAKKLEQVHSEIGFLMVRSAVAAMDRLLADDYRYTNDLRLPTSSLTKEQTLTLFRTGKVRYAYVTTPSPTIEVSNDLKSGFVSGQATVGGWYRGTRFDNSYSYTNLYEKRQDRWQLVRAEAKYH